MLIIFYPHGPWQKVIIPTYIIKFIEGGGKDREEGGGGGGQAWEKVREREF